MNRTPVSAFSARRAARLPAYRRAALIVAHPGHELRVLGWASAATPLVQALTDGSGRGAAARTGPSKTLLTGLDCAIGPVFGHASDARFYKAMLDGEADFFIDLLERLTRGVVMAGCDAVFGDAAEGYNPTHDLCRVLIDAVVLQAQRRTGRRLANYAFRLTDRGAPDETPDPRLPRIVLDDAALADKLAACRAYAEMRAEVDEAVRAAGEDYFRLEVFEPVRSTSLPARPHYHTVGQARVAAGCYERPVLFDAHVAPIAEAIMRHARSGVSDWARPMRGRSRSRPSASTMPRPAARSPRGAVFPPSPES